MCRQICITPPNTHQYLQLLICTELYCLQRCISSYLPQTLPRFTVRKKIHGIFEFFSMISCEYFCFSLAVAPHQLPAFATFSTILHTKQKLLELLYVSYDDQSSCNIKSHTKNLIRITRKHLFDHRVHKYRIYRFDSLSQMIHISEAHFLINQNENQVSIGIFLGTIQKRVPLPILSTFHCQ